LGKEVSIKEVSQIFLRLQDQGAHNINLVTATQYLPSILPALDQVKGKLFIPVVYNCGGYETVNTVKALEGYVDIWLPDLKYESSDLSMRYSGAKDYFQVAKKAINQMILQTGSPQFDSQGSIMKKGVIIRHMVLPGAKDDSIRLLRFMKEELPEGMYYISLMSQYTPFFHSKYFPEINRRITTYEYNKVLDEAIRLGLDSGFMQEKSSAKEEYTPPFDLEGIL
jgi:putative pyruvate formate lyase activating enzyme